MCKIKLNDKKYLNHNMTTEICIDVELFDGE